MRTRLIQRNFTVGDLECNKAIILQEITLASEEQVDLLVFPELALTGYPPEDLLLRDDFLQATSRTLDDITAQTRHHPGLHVVVGWPEIADRWDRSTDSLGRTCHNSLVILKDGQAVGYYRKQLLPNYGVFDEARYFLPGDFPCILEIDGVEVGFLICEDLWGDGPVDYYADEGVDLIVSLNASPYHRGKVKERRQIVVKAAQRAGCPVAYCNLVGGQDELVFDGGSMVVDATGFNGEAHQFVEDALTFKIHNRKILNRQDRYNQGGWSTSTDAEWATIRALTLGVQDYFRKIGATDAVIGLSGGIDSALTAVIAVDALGAHHVHGVAMPGPYSSQGSIDDAQALADNLRLKSFQILPIKGPYLAIEEQLRRAFVGTDPNVAEENIQARLRGLTLMALSNKFGWLVLTTGNKSEMAVGYATLYGDMCGGFSVLKDVPKTLVFDLARYINQVKGTIIPQNTIDKPPSAELAPDQEDEKSLLPYDILDPILEAYVEDDRSREQIVADQGVTREQVDFVCNLVDRSEYKRRQAPPGVKITPRAFGRDRRYPIANGWRS